MAVTVPAPRYTSSGCAPSRTRAGIVGRLCEGTGLGLTEIRCPFHRGAYDLSGRLREVPSRKEFGVLGENSGEFVRIAPIGLILNCSLSLSLLGGIPASLTLETPAGSLGSRRRAAPRIPHTRTQRVPV